MTKLTDSLYGKISIVFLVLLIVLAVVQILVSVNSSMVFVKESDQQLNRSLAQDLAKKFKPFLKDSVNYAGIDQTIHELMVMNPRVEIYLLDATGKILAYFADPEKIKRDRVDLQPVTRFLQSQKDLPIMGDDPRSPVGRKPFSVAPIKIGENTDGYLYVILGGEQYDSAADMIKNSYIVRTSAINLLLVIIATAIVGLILFALLTKRFRNMTDIVKRFEKGNFKERVKIKSNDEIGQLAGAFNQMADTIVANMEELKRTDRLRRELIANVSHDLRGPLASIQGYLETVLIKEENLGAEDRRKYLQIILDNSQMLGKLIGELFELSKLDAKQIEPKMEPLSIAELTQDVVMKFKPQAEKLGVSLKARLPRDLPMVYADVGMIDRALSNLIDNALQYTPEHGMVKVDLSKNQDDTVRVFISDTGCGIPTDEIPYVFERFYRIDKSRGRDSGGSGLGLAIAKKILELHESNIDIESTVNKGTSLWFDLRIASLNTSPYSAMADANPQ